MATFTWMPACFCAVTDTPTPFGGRVSKQFGKWKIQSKTICRGNRKETEIKKYKEIDLDHCEQRCMCVSGGVTLSL